MTPGSKFTACNMADDKGSLRRQVLETTNLLLKAVDKLDAKSSTPSSESGPSSSGNRVPIGHASSSSTMFSMANEIGGSSSGSHVSNAVGTSQLLEMRRLFNWSGIGAKRKKSTADGRPSKKKKLQMYNHTFCCLAHTTQQ